MSHQRIVTKARMSNGVKPSTKSSLYARRSFGIFSIAVHRLTARRGKVNTVSSDPSFRAAQLAGGLAAQLSLAAEAGPLFFPG